MESAHSLNYVPAASYAPQGGLSVFTNGASISGMQTYNARLQPLQLYYTNGTPAPVSQLQTTTCPTTIATIMSLSYDFHATTSNNGNVYGVTDCLNPNRSQHFDYDRLNRIADAYTTGTTAAVGYFGEDYTIDVTCSPLSEQGRV